MVRQRQMVWIQGSGQLIGHPAREGTESRNPQKRAETKKRRNETEMRDAEQRM